jgi:hypothetical protein
MPTAVPSKPRAPRIKKVIDVDATIVIKKKVTRAKKTVLVQEPQHISSGAGMTAGLELWTSATGQVELRDTTVDNRFAADTTAWSSLNAAALKKSKDATAQ